MHLDSAGATQQPAEVSTPTKPCAACQTPFYAKRKWQRFCGAACRNLYHQAMTPEALRRDIDELKHELEELRRRVTVLDEPVR